MQVNVVAEQFLPQGGVPIITVAYQQTPGTGRQVGNHSRLMDIGRGECYASDDAGPAQPDMYSKAVEGLAGKGVFTKGRLPFKPSAAVGTGELTDGDGKTIDKGKVRVIGDALEQVLPSA